MAQIGAVYPPENLFFIDIAAWDKLMNLLKNKNLALEDVLMRAKANNSDPKTKKHYFSMHLDDYEMGCMNLDYINKGYKVFDIFEQLQRDC